MACAACASLSRRLVGAMTEPCADRHDDIADAITGNLSDERRAEFEAHTRSCAGCASEIEALGSLASRLRSTDVDLDSVARFDMPPAGLGAAVTQAIEQARTEDSPVRQLDTRRRRARRISLAVLAAAAVILAIVAIVGLRQSSPGTPAEQVALAPKDIAPGASATAALRPQPYGVAIDLSVDGLDEGTVYALWLADASGTRSPAGTFVADKDGRAALDTSTALPREQGRQDLDHRSHRHDGARRTIGLGGLPMREIETDYLVVGAGATGMAFVDTLIAESDADVVMVDRRHRPGGHWLDAYPFVRLHQPSANYGVNSRILGNDRVDEFGPNAGFYERATAPEICDYFNRVLDETLLPSGQVRIFGMSDYRGVDGDGHHFTSLLSGEDTTVKVRRKVVDATYIESEIPATSQPKFEVDAGVRVLSPNDLVHLGDVPAGYTIIGAGKTAMDTCNWLLDVGVAPDDIRWIKSRGRMVLRPRVLPAARARRLVHDTASALDRGGGRGCIAN